MAVKRIRLGGIESWPAPSEDDPILDDGEPAIDTTTGVVKVGNGTDPFSELPAAGGGSGAVGWADITGKPAVIGAGATQTAARTAIGAGTSSLALGATSTTAKAGDYQPTWAQVTSKPAVATVAAVPASAAATGTAGQIAYDAQFLYVCIAANTWVRAALDTWA